MAPSTSPRVAIRPRSRRRRRCRLAGHVASRMKSAQQDPQGRGTGGADARGQGRGDGAAAPDGEDASEDQGARGDAFEPAHQGSDPPARSQSWIRYRRDRGPAPVTGPTTAPTPPRRAQPDRRNRPAPRRCRSNRTRQQRRRAAPDPLAPSPLCMKCAHTSLGRSGELITPQPSSVSHAFTVPVACPLGGPPPLGRSPESPMTEQAARYAARDPHSTGPGAIRHPGTRPQPECCSAHTTAPDTVLLRPTPTSRR